METALTLLKQSIVIFCVFLFYQMYGLNCRLLLVLYIFYIRNFLFSGEIVDVTCTTLASMIVWRVRGKTIRSVLCNIVCNNCAQCDAHTYEQTNSSVDWVLSHWSHFTVLDSFLYCVLLCVVCMIA